MRLCYVLLSPTWGMHQYTADLANRMAALGHEVHVVTCQRAPRDRYAPAVALHTPVDTQDRGFSVRGLLSARATCQAALRGVGPLRPQVVHVTGPHLVNPLLLRALRRQGVPTVHTLHDVHPHAGSAYGRLLYLWNGWVQREADHLLVHGARFRDELMAGSSRKGRDAVAAPKEYRRDAVAAPGPSRVTCTLLTHLFMGNEAQRLLEASRPEVSYEPVALFIGRLEAYKGLDVLVQAARILERSPTRVVIAGPGRVEPWVQGPLPGNVEVVSGLVEDDQAVDLFRRCGLVVLPYTEASQSALVAAAYFFRKPVVVSRVGALPEYVREGETGWVVPPGDAPALAAAIVSALADPPRLAAMGRAGRAWYEQTRSAEGATLVALYAQLSGQR